MPSKESVQLRAPLSPDLVTPFTTAYLTFCRKYAVTERRGYAPLIVDSAYGILLPDGAVTLLSRQENKAFACFVNNPHKLLSYEKLTEAIWHNPSYPVTTLHTLVYHLRNKLEPGISKQQEDESRYIRTEWGYGYLSTISPVWVENVFDISRQFATDKTPSLASRRI